MNYQDEDDAIFARFLQNFGSRTNSESDLSDISISSDSDNDNTQVIVENDNIRIVLKRARFQRFTRFNLDDHLFNIEIFTKNNREIEVLSIITLIELAIKKSISLLQDEYGSDDEQLFFLTIIDADLDNGINSGGVTFDSEADKIANFISVKLLKYLVQSNEHLKINNSFKIAIKIATRQHVQYRKSIGLGSGIRIGIKVTKKEDLKSSCLLKIPHEEELAFKCLIVSSVVGQSHFFSHYNGPQSHRASEIWRKMQSKEGLALIQDKILDFKTESNFSDMDLTHFDKVLPRLEYFFNCQFAILKEHKNGKNFDCPYRSSNVFTTRLPVIYLLLEENSDAFHHISLITNLYKFYSLYNKVYCPYCNRKFNLKDKHKCGIKDLKHCRTCWRPIAEEDKTMFSQNDSFLFCHPKDQEEMSCLKCCRLIRSHDCQREHRYQCRKVYYCTLCNHYISTGPNARSIETIKQTHNCAFKKCNLCYELYLPSDEHQHLCKMSAEIGQTKWAKLCLIFKNENEITIIKENGQMESFCLFELHPPHFEETTRCEFPMIYLPYMVREKLSNNLELQNASPRFQMNSNDWENKNWTEDILHKLLKKILTEESFENSCIFYIDNDSDFSLNQILKSLLEANITEFKFIQKESRVMRIRFPCEEISFQDITNFLPKNPTEKNVMEIFQNLIKVVFDCLELQTIIFEEKKENKMPYLNPFSGPFATLAGFTYAVFKWFHLPNLDLYALKDENGIHIKSSKEELKWVQWEIYKRRHDKNLTFLHAHSKYGQKYFKSCIPDLVIKGKTLTQALFYHGCYHHCCQVCPDGKRNQGNSEKSRQEIIENDKKKIENLKKEVPGIIVKVIYGCEFQRELSSPSLQLKKFLKFYSNIERPKQRIKPRDGLRGGRTESFCPYFEASNDEEIVHLDINSSYSFQSLGEFPLGQPSTIIGHDLKEVVYCSNAKKYFFGTEEVLGLVHCKIVAPKNLHLPYFGYRHKENNEVFTCYSLCRKCAEKGNNSHKCRHGEKNRSFVCTITSIELNSLRNLHYDITIYEILHYSKKEKIFANFTNALNRLRVKYNGFPNGVENLEDRTHYLDEINKTLTHPLFDIEKNEAFKKIWKSAMVSFLGKFGEKQTKKKVKFLSDLDDFEEYVFTATEKGKKVVLSEVSDNLCQVSIFRKPSGKQRKGNVVYTALINAMARDKLYFDILKLQKANCRILYIDTDAVIFAKKKTQSIPLEIGLDIGQWKIEHKNIKSFFAMGLKNYILCFEDEKITPTIKISGLTTGSLGLEYLEKYKKLVWNSHLDKPIEKIVLSQEIRKTTCYKTEIEILPFSIQSQRKRRKYFLRQGIIQSLPFGFIK